MNIRPYILIKTTRQLNLCFIFLYFYLPGVPGLNTGQTPDLGQAQTPGRIGNGLQQVAGPSSLHISCTHWLVSLQNFRYCPDGNKWWHNIFYLSCGTFLL